MPRINQQLLGRLKSTLGVNAARVYQVIADKASETLLDRHLAAFVVASENGINVQKYSTPEERAQIRGSLRPGGGTSSAQQVSPTISPEPQVRKRAKAKGSQNVAKA